MAKITEQSRAAFAKASDEYKARIKEIEENEKSMLLVMKNDSVGIEYKKIILCEQMIYASTIFMAINTCSLKILEIKNNEALNEARKLLYKAIIYLEEVVTNVINCPPSELSDKMELLKNTDIKQRYYLVRKLGLAIRMNIDAFGENSKWKWSFVELEGRYATVAKNYFDFKAFLKIYFDPNSADYDTVVFYIRLIKKLLDKSASAYRDKYELSTRRIDDMQNGIKFLLAERRVVSAIEQQDEAEEIKKKAIAWKEKMEADQKAGKSN